MIYQLYCPCYWSPPGLNSYSFHVAPRGSMWLHVAPCGSSGCQLPEDSRKPSGKQCYFCYRKGSQLTPKGAPASQKWTKLTQHPIETYTWNKRRFLVFDTYVAYSAICVGFGLIWHSCSQLYFCDDVYFVTVWLLLGKRVLDIHVKWPILVCFAFCPLPIAYRILPLPIWHGQRQMRIGTGAIISIGIGQ